MPSTFLAVVPDRESLPFAEQEVASIPDSLFPSTTFLFDRRATTTEFIRQAVQSDVIHIAAHGAMHRWHPLFSYLRLSDGQFDLHRILSLQLSSRIVILSACETGYGVGMMGDIAQGHEIVGFPQAFLLAGVSSVIAPLWVVEDEATSLLMSSFYSHLARLPFAVPAGRQGQASLRLSDGSLPTGSFANALGFAQREFVLHARKTHNKNHPFYWAGFYLTGNPN